MNRAMMRFCLLVIAVSLSGCEVRCSRESARTNAASTAPAMAGPFTVRPPDSGEMPAAQPVSRMTPAIFVAWSNPNLHVGEAVRVQLIVVNAGAAAPPGTVVLESTVQATSEGANHGVGTFTMPTAGWPPGQYRSVAAAAAGPFAQIEFTIAP